jgi:hypothetical protein
VVGPGVRRPHPRVFRNHYPEGRSFQVAADVEGPFTRDVAGDDLRVVGLEDFIAELRTRGDLARVRDGGLCRTRPSRLRHRCSMKSGSGSFQGSWSWLAFLPSRFGFIPGSRAIWTWARVRR